MKKTDPLVSIITVNYNGRRFLDGCFKSLLNLNYPKDKLEIFMVDNGSTDDSLQFVRENYPQIKILQNDVNNYCKANNLGISRSKGEYVALLNNDTKVDKDWLYELLRVLESDESIGAAGSKILLPDGRIQDAGHLALPNFYWAERGFGEEKTKYDKLEEAASLCGAAVLYRKKTFEKVGLFDEDFVIYMEDVDMAFRLRNSGWKILFAPESIVYHEFHGTANNDLSRLYIERNRLLFIAKYYPDKLSQALFGRGYFTVEQGLNDCGKIYQVMPDVIAKLQKHHNINKVKSVLSELLKELEKISNYENHILIKDILGLKEQLEQKQQHIQKQESELSQNKTELSQNKTELYGLKAKLSQAQSEVTQTKTELSIKTHIINERDKELSGIYSSEGFRFILRPLWDILWNIKKILRAVIWGLKQPVHLLFAITLCFLNLAMAMLFLFDYFLWQISKIFLRIKIPNRNLINFKDLKITIVIPNYNGERYLRECLPSIFASTDFQNYVDEVLIVDDASTDNSINYIKSNFPKINIICNDKNMGFGKSCNMGIKAAKNELIILLNNDIILSEDFIRPLVGHFKNKEVFAVSPRLYHWDRQTFLTGMYLGDFKYGYVHIWNERDKHAYPEINNAAPTMFAIGCATCFRKDDFLSMGGFDGIYEPYSWEDIDISYRALKRGLRVIYEPNSVAFHKMHGTIGTFNRAIERKNELLFTWKNITDLNMVIGHFILFPLYFLSKAGQGQALFRGYLLALGSLFAVMKKRSSERKHFLYTDREILHRPLQFYMNYKKNRFLPNISNAKKTILILTPFLPYPLKSGGQVKMYNSLKSLSGRYDIILLSFIEHKEQEQYVLELNKLCKKVFTVLRRPRWRVVLDKMGLPVFVKYFYAKEMKEKLLLCLKDYSIDLVQIEYVNMAYYATFLPDIPKVLVEHDTSIYTLTNSCEKPIFGKTFQFFDWLNWRHFQKLIYPYFEKIITFSEEDCRIAGRAAPRNKISIIPIGLDLAGYGFSEDNKKTIDILFVGHMLHYPNIDGLNYFIRRILPLIKKELNNVKFCVVGSCMERSNLRIKNDANIDLIGEVPDIKPYLSKAKVMVAPIRLGGGIKVKILEAMAMGLPVVATKLAAKGLNVVPGKDICIANSVSDFAEKVLALIQDERRRIEIGKNALDAVRRRYDINKICVETDALHDSILLNDNIMENDELKSMIFRKPLEQDNPSPTENNSKITATWDIILRCNYRCPYCFNDGKWEQLEAHNKPYSQKDWLNFWERIYERYGEIDLFVSGGEPFLYQDFLGLMKKMVLMHRLHICTNLSTDINKIVNEFVPQRFILHPSFHPYYADLEEFIQKIYILKQRGWLLESIIVAYPPLLSKLSHFKNRFTEGGVNIYVQPFIGQYQGKQYPEEYTDSERELIASFNNLDLINHQLNSINSKGKSCKTGFKYFRVHPDGSISRCAGAKNILGRIEDRNFQLLCQAMPCDQKFCICNNELVYLSDDKKRVNAQAQ